jgi:hypothetical protein
MKIRYSRRRDTAGHHALRLRREHRCSSQTQADFWHPTGGDVHVRVGVHAAGDGAYFSASLYHGHSHPSSEVEGVARTRWPSDL